LMRSESCAFIWHPKVVTWYLRIAEDASRILRSLSRVNLWFPRGPPPCVRAAVAVSLQD
jgi:hypothetical protein